MHGIALRFSLANRFLVFSNRALLWWFLSTMDLTRWLAIWTIQTMYWTWVHATVHKQRLFKSNQRKLLLQWLSNAFNFRRWRLVDKVLTNMLQLLLVVRLRFLFTTRIAILMNEIFNDLWRCLEHIIILLIVLH